MRFCDGSYKRFSKLINFAAAVVVGIFFFSSQAQSQEITAIDFNGAPLGKVIPDGKVVSFDNRLLGNVTADSFVVDSSGRLIGGVVPQGVAIGNDARFLGKVGSDGIVRSPAGQNLGRALPNGLVVNEYFDILGEVIFPGLVYNDEGAVSGRVTGDGLYTDLAGRQIGIITPDGYAYRKIGNDYLLDGHLISSKMVVSLEGDFIGSIVPGGQVTDFNSEIIGQIKANGFVYNNDSQIIGRVVLGGYAFDNSGFYLGIVSYNGEVVSANKVVGKARADGRVVDINNNIVGYFVNTAATATDLKGQYLGRILPDGTLAKSASSNGLVGARGVVSDASGAIIGSLIQTGPVFDYKGTLKGHALSNGSVISLNGTTIGYMIGSNAYNLSGVAMGAVLTPKVVFSTNNSFLGISGISTSFDNQGSKLFASPLGYVFDQVGNLAGRALGLDTFVTPFGTVSSYMGLNGRAVDSRGNDLGSIFGQGYVLNPQNQLIAKSINAVFATDYRGKSLGMLSFTNLVLDKALKATSKILPDGSVSEIASGNINYLPKVGEASAALIARDFSGGLLGYADIIGNINNAGGAKIGSVAARGFVVDNSGIVIGYVSGYGAAINDKCELIGVVSSNGGLYNYRDVYVGKALANGLVISDSGASLGYVALQSPVIDFTGKIIGFPSFSGSVINEKGEVLGCLDRQGQLRNADKSLVGKAIEYESVIDFGGQIIGYSTLDGSVVNSDNDIIGYQQPNDNVNSAAGVPIGGLFKYRVAFDLDNKFLGYVTSEGKVINQFSEDVGAVDFDGYVVSSKQKIGYALYDFYVYDNNNQVIGIINRNGEVSSFTNQNLGRFDRGFVIKGDVVIARGNRDYNIRDAAHLVLGQLQLDGRVLDNFGNVIGRLDTAGQIIDNNSKVIAVATPLQFYSSVSTAKKLQMIFDENGNFIGYLDENGNLVDENGNVIGRVDENGNIVNKDGKVVGNISANKLLYDADGKVIGYIDEKGNIVDLNGNVIGRLDDNGNLVDTSGNTIGHLDADGNIVSPDGKIIGHVASAQQAYNSKGEIIGTVDKNGNVIDKQGKIIGKVNEKGEVVDANGNIIGRIGRKWFDSAPGISPTEATQNSVQDEDISPALKLLEQSKYYKSLGIALTPDGEYLGEILENDTVVDEKGNIIGYRMPDGLIIDDEGNLIGTEDFGTEDDIKDGNIFVPAGSFGPGGAYGVGSGSAGNLGPGGGYGPGERYDPTRRAALNAAMQERRQNISVGKISSGYRKEAFDGYQKDWSEQGIPKSVSSWRVDMSEMIFSDKPIPAVIARAIDTNNPAPITAYVERNVYAEEGRNIIIPAGSRLIGAFGSITAAAEATSESARVQISWERLIRPDGSIFIFSGQTADAQGRAGALGYVDQQLFKKYTLPVITTVLTSGTSYFIASADDAAGEIETSRQQAANDARQNFLDDMEELFDDILADKTDVKAMTYIPAGTRIIVYPNMDLWLRSVERDNEESQKYQKPEILIDDVKTRQDMDQTKREDVAKAASSGQVVYDPDDAGVEAAGSGTTPLLVDTAPKKKTTTLAPPPPPASGSISAAPAQMPDTGASSATTNSSIPALF